MNILVTGSSGHLGEALMRALPSAGHTPVGVDLLPSPFTQHVGSLADRAFARRCLADIEAVLHTATLHKPHVATHTRQQFVDANVTATLNLLEESTAAKVRAFVFTSTTSTFGRALVPPPGEPAAWLTEQVTPVPKNIYGVTKVAAESLCELFHRNAALPLIVLRTSRFFPEADDDDAVRAAYADANSKVSEFLYRRVDLEDVVDAHLLALARAPELGFGRYIVSAPTPFLRDDAADLRRDAAAVLERRCPGWRSHYEQLGWRMFPSIDRVYDATLAQTELGWRPRSDFRTVLDRFLRTGDVRSELARAVGMKGYHRVGAGRVG